MGISFPDKVHGSSADAKSKAEEAAQRMKVVIEHFGNWPTTQLKQLVDELGIQVTGARRLRTPNFGALLLHFIELVGLELPQQPAPVTAASKSAMHQALTWRPGAVLIVQDRVDCANIVQKTRERVERRDEERSQGGQLLSWPQLGPQHGNHGCAFQGTHTHPLTC